MAENAENQTVAEITKAYEQKIVELQKQHEKEIQVVKENAQKEKEKALEEQKTQFNKDLADVILGRKEVSEIEKTQDSDEKSYFDKAVENTKKKLKEG